MAKSGYMLDIIQSTITFTHSMTIEMRIPQALPKLNTTTSLTPRPSTTPSRPPLRRQSPIILTLKLIMQRRNRLRLLPLTQAIRRRNLEECRRRLNQPFRFNRTADMHVFLRRLHKTVVHDVFRRFAEKTGRGVQVHRRAFDECFVAFGGIFARGVAEEA
jgi:hypothetical protein